MWDADRRASMVVSNIKNLISSELHRCSIEFLKRCYRRKWRDGGGSLPMLIACRSKIIELRKFEGDIPSLEGPVTGWGFEK
jgi:hypothetical protein